MKKQKLQHWILAADLVWASIAMAMAYVLTYGTMLDSTGEKRLFTFVPLLLCSLVLWAGLFDLREMRPKLGQKHARFHPFRSSNASLHAKALVIDQKIVFIGSLNMDERSAKINSELGLVISSAEIAHEVTSLLDDISTDGSYKLQLDPHGRVEWVSGEGSTQKIWHTEPETSRTERAWLTILSPFAPDEIL